MIRAGNRWLAALLALAVLTACSSANGRETAATARPARIVSLVPSLTEDLFAVGAGAQVVGVSSYTDYPPEARRLPVVASFASLDAERIVALHPDLCVGIDAQARLSQDLQRAGLRIVLMKDDSYEDIFANLRRLGELSGHRAQANALVATLQARTARIVRAVNAKRRARRPSVFVVLGVDPIFTVGRGSYIERLIDLAGGRNASADVGQPYARYSAEALLARQPDLLVVDPDIPLSSVIAKPPWNALRAVASHHVYTLPDAAILERPGPRYNDGLSWLAGAIDRATR
ncbi:MAG TPA: helical backbone metal receptor [Candidatus Elarobacter sp.]|jgi:iron complex transport system substrate-binding protein|nr:helical backbone metal receptor [Candidatus Elarobacter sp.]